uniref:Uncharacterized protein n=1 Tax=Oryza meridionalis TaxID=40149 RepID=A0A0E0CSB4_9ORYZ
MSTSRGVDDGPAVQQLFRWKKWLTERERGRCVPRRLWRMVGEIGGSRNGGTGAARRKKCDPHGTAIPKKPPGTNGTHGHQQAGWLTERERGRCVPRRLWRMVGEIGGSRNGGTGAARRKKCDPHGTAIPKKPPGTNGTHGHQQAGGDGHLRFGGAEGMA